MKLKSLILLAFVAALSACSFEKNDSLTDPNEIANRERLKTAYDSIAGTYRGVLKASNRDQTIEIRLFRLEGNNGSNSSGAESKKPTLNGTYKRIDPTGLPYEFSASYIQDTNELILTNRATNLSNDDVHTINAQIINNRIVGKATFKGGNDANIDLPLITRENGGNDGTTDENEYWDGVRRELTAIAGKYQGELLLKDGKLFITAEMTLQVYNNTSPNGKYSIPYLLGTFHDVKDVVGHDPITKEPIGFSDLSLTAIYNTDVLPRRLDLRGAPVNGGTRFVAELRLELINGQLVGTYQQAPVLTQATVTFKKVAPAKMDEN
jgi:hypothetical protein